MYHLLANYANAADSVLTDLAPLSDNIIPVTNSHWLLPQDMQVPFAVAFGTNLNYAYLTSPRLRQVNPTYIRPIQPTLIGANLPNAYLSPSVPIHLSGQEETQVFVFQNAGVAQHITVLLAVMTQFEPVPPGQIYIVHATSTTAVTANAWTLISYTLDTALPAGMYAVVLCEHRSANSQAVRLTFDNQFFRPGMVGLSALGQGLPYRMYQYPLGKWGQFSTFSLPRVEILANGADNSHDLYFHVIKVA